jgi:DNA-binding CsgD family transcriptional regulator/tetratricopeptide (TPR) repeat protein
LGRTYYFDGDALQARTLAEESLAVARAVGDSWLIAWAIHLLGLASYISGDYPAALTHYQESLRIRQEIGDEADIPILHYLMGFAAYRAGDQVQAIAHYTDSLARAQKGRFLWHLIHVLGGLSALAAAHSQPEGAVLLAAAAWRRSEILGMLPIPICAAILQESIERVRPSLSVDAYAVAWARGLALSEDEALTEARAVAAAVSEKLRGVLPAGPERQGITAPSVQAPPLEHSLSPRELEVLRLIVDGRTSKEIAAELIISVPTVERHITHIYAKIGARRRADATAYAVLHGLI